MRKLAGLRLEWICLTLATVLFFLVGGLHACTIVVFSGRITADHRPLLWKNRDYGSAPRNEVVIFGDGKFRVIGVVNAGDRSRIWMGQNESGLCICNSLSVDLRNGKKNRGLGNGQFMKTVLQTCASVQDIVDYLNKTNASGRQTIGNFGVIDAKGGAVMFEIGPDSFQMFDANDPNIAPNGYIVRSNFATTAHQLGPIPTPNECKGVSSSERYCRASKLLAQRQGEVSVEFVLQNMARDLAIDGSPIPGSINSTQRTLPKIISTQNTISRTTTVSAAVFHGVRIEEDPRNTTMWVTLGDPKFSISVPCWTNLKSVADSVEGKRGGEIGEIARTIRDASLTQKSDALQSKFLPGIWQDLWRREKEIVRKTAIHRNTWGKDGFNAAAATKWHQEAAAIAYASMRRELHEAKSEALDYSDLKQSAKVRKGQVRVAVYDHSKGTSTGPKNLATILNAKNGFQMQRITPIQIRSGELSKFDVLVIPGGSGSKQSRMLEEKGRQKVRKFVDGGGGYVGICAGSYLASSRYTWSLDLINASVWDRAHWARGTGMVTLELTSQGKAALNLKSFRSSVYYGQGPLLVPGDHPNLPKYEVLAEYETEIVSKGAVSGAMKDTHAIIRSTFGQGRVICFSPHPERPGGPAEMIVNGVRWAANPEKSVTNQ